MEHLAAEGFVYRRRVQFAETDLAGIVHFSWFFRYMEEAEHALWRAAGLSIAPPGQPGWARVSAAFDFKAPLRFEEEFEVIVAIAAVGRRTIEYACTVRRGGTLVGSGRMTTVPVSHGADGGLKSTDVPPDVVDRLRAAAQRDEF